MDIGRVTVSSTIAKEIRQHYKNLITKSGNALTTHGRNSTEYALALALITATVTAVQVAYGMKDAHAAHEFLK